MKTSNARSHKYKHGGRVFNPYTFVFSTLILVLWMISEVNHYDDTYVRENEPQVFLAPVIVDHPEDESIETKIRKYFPRSHVTMIAIAHAESGMNNSAKNWNCWYDKDGKISSTYIKGGGQACKVEDRKYAFGVDCFVLQAHYIGRKDCPKDVSLDQHLQEMAELSKARSFQPWVVYNTGVYRRYLANR